MFLHILENLPEKGWEIILEGRTIVSFNDLVLIFGTSEICFTVNGNGFNQKCIIAEHVFLSRLHVSHPLEYCFHNCHCHQETEDKVENGVLWPECLCPSLPNPQVETLIPKVISGDGAFSR